VRACLTRKEVVADLLQHFWDHLQPESQSMFLDVATLLRHHSYADAEAVWIGWHGICAPDLFQDLVQRCLVEVREGLFSHAWGWISKREERVEMHDLLVELGRAKIRDPGSQHFGSRIWVEGGEVVGCKEVR
jgi:hypothetical protein